VFCVHTRHVVDKRHVCNAGMRYVRAPNYKAYESPCAQVTCCQSLWTSCAFYDMYSEVDAGHVVDTVVGVVENVKVSVVQQHLIRSIAVSRWRVNSKQKSHYMLQLKAYCNLFECTNDIGKASTNRYIAAHTASPKLQADEHSMV